MDLIIGAGVTGLSYAAFTNNDYLIVEATDSIGGYCKTIKKDGYTWDYSGHFFHFRNNDIKEFVLKNMDMSKMLEVKKNTSIYYKGKLIDFPFQKNIHQLPTEEFTECIYDLYFNTYKDTTANTFKEMVYKNYGKSIAEKFLVPYNEKLYACNLDNLDSNAMGRFFPATSLEDIIANFKNSNNSSYNDTFVYPKGGAIEYVNSIATNVDKDKIMLNTLVTNIDIINKIAHLYCDGETREIKYDNLISTMPYNQLLNICDLKHNSNKYTYNKVLVYNIGFNKKGTNNETSWMYFPSKEFIFYRVGFYNNIMGTDKMSLYVEIGLDPHKKVHEISEIDTLIRIYEDLAKCGIVTDEKIASYESVIMNPAYVHINKEAINDKEHFDKILNENYIYSIGRYGSWTYCSIEDNIIEAKKTAEYLSCDIMEN